MVFAGVAALAGTLLIAMLMLLFSGSERSKHIAALEDELKNQPLLPTQSTRPVLITPSRTGPMSGVAAAIGGRTAELADMKVDVSWSRFTTFRVTIDRIDQGRVLVLGSLQRDSNGHLRLALNSSALGPGEYSVLLEGLDWRGTPNREGWFNFSLHAEVIHHARLAGPRIVTHRAARCFLAPASRHAVDPKLHTQSTLTHHAQAQPLLVILVRSDEYASLPCLPNTELEISR